MEVMSLVRHDLILGKDGFINSYKINTLLLTFKRLLFLKFH